MPRRTTRLLLLIVAMFASPVGPAADAQPGYEQWQSGANVLSQGDWRRTSQGWEQTNRWPSEVDSIAVSPVSRIHPTVLAALIGLLSVGALVGFDSSRHTSRL